VGEDQGEHIAADIGRHPGRFTLLAAHITTWSGSGPAAAVVVAALGVWLIIGITAGFDQWWQACVSIVLAFVTLLMLVLIQHTQNHDAQAVQLKLDELLRASKDASKKMMLVEEASDAELDRIRRSFEQEATSD
jgi:low affinity Fe/Cu permease